MLHGSHGQGDGLVVQAGLLMYFANFRGPQEVRNLN